MNYFNVRRRQFLKTAALAPFLLSPRIWASIPNNPEVIIIGAGAAGLAAAKTLLKKNISCIILEGNSRIGGRAFTESTTFGVPYDQGCHWIMESGENFWRTYAKENGFNVYKDPYPYDDGDPKVNVFTGSVADIGYNEDLNDAIDALEKNISKAAEAALDISAADANKDYQSAWKQVAENWYGAWDMGKDFDNFSTQDWYNSPWATTYFCKEGYGSIVAHYGQGLPVKLNTIVSEIDWSGSEVKVKTNNGSLTGKTVIVTVSTGILAAGNIKFTPALPSKKQESFHKISMGSYNHIGLQFKRDIFNLGSDAFLAYKTESEKSTGFFTNISGTNLSYAMVGGRFGWELERAGFDAGVDFALAELIKIYGHDIKKDFIKGHFPRWGHNTWTLGSYASAEPGAYPYRKILRESIGDKIFFAGEATHRLMWATCHGARITGEDAAKAVTKIVLKK
jgi:monoamine oxidase